METVFQILKQVSRSWKWGSQVCNSRVLWRACTLSSDFCALSVGRGFSVVTSPPDQLVLCSWSAVDPAGLRGTESSSQCFSHSVPLFWLFLGSPRLPHLASWADTFQTPCQSGLDGSRERAPTEGAQLPAAWGLGMRWTSDQRVHRLRRVLGNKVKLSQTSEGQI